MKSFLKENIKIAISSIRAQMLRSVLTILIIGIGIAALVGTITAIEAIKASISSNLSSMGSNTFTIRNKGMNVRIGRKGKKAKKFPVITYEQAMRFKEEFQFPAITSISTLASFTATLKYESKKTNPNIQVMGGDENYLVGAGFELEKGRNFSPQEIQHGNHVVIIGKDLVYTLFENKSNPIDKIISIGSGKYKVIGVLKEKGSSMEFGGDKVCMIPLNNVRQYFSYPDMSFTISVLCNNASLLEIGTGEAEGYMRKARGLQIGEEDNFEVVKSDNLANIVIGSMSKFTIGAIVIAMITLFGAAIGLMNSLLVSVKERTKEIGVRKSLGATKKNISNQFLIEAVVICQLGGATGILLGLLLGNILSYSMDAGFVMPWGWVMTGILLCFIVGLVSGIVPAIRASKLDPIEALRHE